MTLRMDIQAALVIRDKDVHLKNTANNEGALYGLKYAILSRIWYQNKPKIANKQRKDLESVGVLRHFSRGGQNFPGKEVQKHTIWPKNT
jgi:hypothetical protein